MESLQPKLVSWQRRLYGSRRLWRAAEASRSRAVRKLTVCALCLVIASPSRPARAHNPLTIRHGQGNHLLLQAQQQTAFQRGLVALQANHLDVALEEFTTAEREHPDNAKVRNFRGIVLAQLGRMVEAAAEYREAVRDDPRFETAYRNLGFLEWNDHQLDTARRDLEAALKLVPEDAFASYYLGRVELELQQYGDAFVALKHSGIPLPDDPDVLTAAAKGYLTLGRQQDARNLAHRVATHMLTRAQTSGVASLLLAVHESEAAIHLLQRWNEKTPGKEESWADFDLGLAYLLAGDYRRAAEQANRCPVQPPSPTETSAADRTADTCSLLGIANAHLGKGDQAVDALRRAASFAPQREEHWLNLTRELMELDRFTQAISTTEEAIRSHPDSYALHLRLGAADLAVDRYKEAEIVFRQLILAGDPLPTSSIGLAQVLLRTGHAQEAVAELADARKRLGPGFLLSYFQGLALNRAGQPSDAATAFREALQQNAVSAEAHSELGKTELKLAHFDESIAQLQTALHLNPADTQARHLLLQAYHRSGKPSNNSETSEVTSPPQVTDPAGDFVLPDWQ
jgi:tetratricopeptide (TPR) repeat protein